MSTAELLIESRQQGIEFSVENDRVRCRAPKGVLTSALQGLLAERREEILSILRAQHPVIESVLPTATPSKYQYEIFSHPPGWQWVPERPVVIDALQYSVLRITQDDREIATQLCDKLCQPNASMASADEERSMLAKIAACKFLKLDPHKQPFTTEITCYRDLIFNGAGIYVVSSAGKNTITMIPIYAAPVWQFALVVVLRNETAHARGYLSRAEVAALCKRGEGGCNSHAVRISYGALKPWEWLEHEVAAQI